MSNRIVLDICEGAGEVARKSAARIADLVRNNHRAVLGLATGSTPLETYRELVRLHREEGLSFAGVRTFNLDEYWGLDGDHPQSYRHFMQSNLFDHIDIAPWNTHVLSGIAVQAEAECRAFEEKIAACGGVDLWLLGIGGNGHIAFNEPGSPISSRTRIVTLSQETIDANSDGRFFSNRAEVPRCALTAGIATIRGAREIVLLATGKRKADAISKAIGGPFSEECPASLLQDHPSCTFVVDRDAAPLA